MEGSHKGEFPTATAIWFKLGNRDQEFWYKGKMKK